MKKTKKKCDRIHLFSRVSCSCLSFACCVNSYELVMWFFQLVCFSHPHPCTMQKAINFTKNANFFNSLNFIVFFLRGKGEKSGCCLEMMKINKLFWVLFACHFHTRAVVNTSLHWSSSSLSLLLLLHIMKFSEYATDSYLLTP